LNTPGIYYFFLKSLAWEGVNIIEIISVEDEVTLVLEDKDAQNAYTILQSLFSK
jgi:aspartokinase